MDRPRFILYRTTAIEAYNRLVRELNDNLFRDRIMTIKVDDIYTDMLALNNCMRELAHYWNDELKIEQYRDEILEFAPDYGTEDESEEE